MTQPGPGRRMVVRCRRARLPFGWVASLSAYGQDHKLRATLEHRRIPYAMAVPVDETVSTHGTGCQRVDKPAADNRLVYERCSCNVGARSLRSYGWALAEATRPGGAEVGLRRGHALLLPARYSISGLTEIAGFPDLLVRLLHTGSLAPRPRGCRPASAPGTSRPRLVRSRHGFS